MAPELLSPNYKNYYSHTKKKKLQKSYYLGTEPLLSLTDLAQLHLDTQSIMSLLHYCAVRWSNLFKFSRNKSEAKLWGTVWILQF